MNQNPSIRNIVRLIIQSADSILLAKVKNKNFYFLPGGGLEFGESVRDAAIRELSEEIGAPSSAVESVELVGVYEHCWMDKDAKVHEINLICQASLPSFSHLQPIASREPHIEFEWVSCDAISKIDFRPKGFVEQIPQWRSLQNQTSPLLSGSLKSN